jgi:hypothetical protein
MPKIAVITVPASAVPLPRSSPAMAGTSLCSVAMPGG